MTAIGGVVATVACCAVLAALARATARQYGLMFSGTRPCALALWVGAVAEVAWLGTRGDIRPSDPLLLAACAAAAATDLQTGYIFDRVLAAGAVALVVLDVLGAANARDVLAGAAIGGGALLVPYVATRARGLGLGDVKFAAVAGLGLGGMRASEAVWIAFVLAGTVGAGLVMMRRANRHSELRFGPFIALGACCALVFP